MNARSILPRSIAILFIVATTANVQAGEWRDMLAAPFSDPLLARPPELDHGKPLPGDSEVHPCAPGQTLSDQTLTLSDAIDIALCHHPQVNAAWARIKIQAAQVGQARSSYLPTINAGVRYQQEKTRQPDSTLLRDTERSGRSEYFTLTWRLLDFGGRGANRRLSDALLEGALASHDAALQKTVGAAVTAYFEAQTAAARRDARESNETLARQIVEATLKRAAKGVAAQSDILQVQTALAKAELEHVRAIGQHERSLVTLSIALGMQGRAMRFQVLPADPAGSPEAASADMERDLTQWLEAAQQQHPALTAARSQLDAARQKLVAVRSEGLPTLEFNQSYFVNGRPNQGSTGGRTREAVTGLSLNIPVFDGFSSTYKLRDAQAQIDVREAELMETQDQVLGDIARAHADTAAALRNLASSRRLQESAIQALENVQRKYDRGLIDILEVLNVQAALVDAREERIRTLADWRSARLRLLASAGEISRTRIAEQGR